MFRYGVEDWGGSYLGGAGGGATSSRVQVTLGILATSYTRARLVSVVVFGGRRVATGALVVAASFNPGNVRFGNVVYSLVSGLGSEHRCGGRPLATSAAASMAASYPRCRKEEAVLDGGGVWAGREETGVGGLLRCTRGSRPVRVAVEAGDREGGGDSDA